MVILAEIVSVLIACAPAAGGSDFSARAVLWRDSSSPNSWDVYMLVRNESGQTVRVPRFPETYNTHYPGKGSSVVGHYDCYAAKFPDDYVVLAPKKVHVWCLTIAQEKKDVEQASLEMVVSASFVAYVAEKPTKQNVECFLISRQKPTPEAWLLQKVLEASDGKTRKVPGKE